MTRSKITALLMQCIKASNEARDLQRQTLKQRLQDLKKRLNSFEEVIAEYEAVRQEQEDHRKDLQEELQNETAPEEMCAAMKQEKRQ